MDPGHCVSTGPRKDFIFLGCEFSKNPSNRRVLHILLPQNSIASEWFEHVRISEHKRNDVSKSDLFLIGVGNVGNIGKFKIINGALFFFILFIFIDEV